MIKGKYDVLEVSRHIINYSWEIGAPIDNLKLQKLLYFIQAQFMLVYIGVESCFSENISAWRYGPVVIKSYNQFKEYGSNNIDPVDKYIDVKCDDNSIELVDVEFLDNEISGFDKMVIQSVVDFYKKSSGTMLIKETHVKDGPWDKAYIEGEKCIITKEDMYSYYFGRTVNGE